MLKTFTVFSVMATASVLASSPLLSYISITDDTAYGLKRMYLSAGKFRQNQWNRFIDIVGDDFSNLFTYGTCLVSFITYWVIGGIYTYLDVFKKPSMIRKYKIQPGTNESITFKNLSEVVRVVLFNQIVVSVPVAYFLAKIMTLRDILPVRELPPFHTTVIQFIFLALIEEVGFYYSHRLLHHRLLYKYIHKKHHKWTAPISITALYSNPIEHVFSNILPLFFGVFILKCHISTIWFWFGFAVAFTLNEHSGYHFPFLTSSEAHDFHHMKFTNCFGVLGILDWVHGTDLEFRKSMSYSRHRILLGFTCARNLFPDLKENSKLEKKKN